MSCGILLAVRALLCWLKPQDKTSLLKTIVYLVIEVGVMSLGILFIVKGLKGIFS
jgi:hypothetical protein